MQQTNLNELVHRFKKYQALTLDAFEFTVVTLSLVERQKISDALKYNLDEMAQHGFGSCYYMQLKDTFNKAPLSFTDDKVRVLLLVLQMLPPRQKQLFQKRILTPEPTPDKAAARLNYYLWVHKLPEIKQLAEQLLPEYALHNGQPVLKYFQQATESTRQKIPATLKQAEKIAATTGFDTGVTWLSGQLMDLYIKDKMPRQKRHAREINDLASNIEWFSWTYLIQCPWDRRLTTQKLNYASYCRREKLMRTRYHC